MPVLPPKEESQTRCVLHSSVTRGRKPHRSTQSPHWLSHRRVLGQAGKVIHGVGPRFKLLDRFCPAFLMPMCERMRAEPSRAVNQWPEPECLGTKIVHRCGFLATPVCWLGHGGDYSEFLICE